MNLLISTPHNSCFVVAVGEERIERLAMLEKEYKQSELLLKSIDKIIKGRTIKNIFVVNGPGAFSALRIGIATGNALAFGWKIPVVGVKLKKSWLNLSEKEKTEKVWRNGVSLLKNKAKARSFVLPIYGQEPNITVKVKS